MSLITATHDDLLPCPPRNMDLTFGSDETPYEWMGATPLTPNQVANLYWLTRSFAYAIDIDVESGDESPGDTATFADTGTFYANGLNGADPVTPGRLAWTNSNSGQRYMHPDNDWTRNTLNITANPAGDPFDNGMSFYFDFFWDGEWDTSPPPYYPCFEGTDGGGLVVYRPCLTVLASVATTPNGYEQMVVCSWQPDTLSWASGGPTITLNLTAVGLPNLTLPSYYYETDDDAAMTGTIALTANAFT